MSLVRHPDFGPSFSWAAHLVPLPTCWFKPLLWFIDSCLASVIWFQPPPSTLSPGHLLGPALTFSASLSLALLIQLPALSTAHRVKAIAGEWPRAGWGRLLHFLMQFTSREAAFCQAALRQTLFTSLTLEKLWDCSHPSQLILSPWLPQGCQEHELQGKTVEQADQSEVQLFFQSESLRLTAKSKRQRHKSWKSPKQGCSLCQTAHVKKLKSLIY